MFDFLKPAAPVAIHVDYFSYVHAWKVSKHTA